MIVSSLSAGYGPKTVVDNVSFSVKPGTLTAVLGPNGSGKSTLAKAILGVGPWVKGEVRVGSDEQLISKAPAHKRARHIAFVPQNEVPSYPFTVREATLMGRLAHDPRFLDSREDLEIAEVALQKADCLKLADKRVTELSGGELQRVWLARALAQRTDSLILDEPTAHLDPSHVVAFARIVAGMKAEGITMLGIFHDLNLALALADRFLIMRNGRLQTEAPISALRDQKLLESHFDTRFVERIWLGPDYS